MDRKRKPGIYLLTDAGDAVELILVWLDDRETRLRGQSPAEELVSFVNFDFSTYRASVERLWEEHDVFEERDEVPYEDYVDFTRQALPLAEQLAEIAPVAYWDVLHYLGPATKMLYDGKSIFPSRKALAVLNALRHPYFIQNRLRNLFEIGFADFERGTQQDRFRMLEDTWPGLIDRAFPIRFLPEPSGAPVGTVREYALDDLYELCLAELSLYFQQDRRRIARCENCWRYFVPRTEAGSRYCYGKMDGKPCKQEGAKRMRRFRADTDEALAAYDGLAGRLSDIRRGAAEQLSARLSAELAGLGMPHARFGVQFSRLDGEAPSARGVDGVEFLFSANRGEPLKPLSRVASGGELSRVMLALKCVFSDGDGIDTMVFDEIDAGISGQVGNAVAQKLRQIASGHQVLCITHLPQIAASAHAQFHVFKQEIDGKTVSSLTRLDEAGRCRELARIMGSRPDDPVALRHARQLLLDAQAAAVS